MRTLVGIGLAVALVGLLVVGGVGLALAQEQAPEHEHPDEVEDGGDSEALARWFGSRMGEIHVDCSEGLTVGNYDACEDLEGEYDSYLERYVSVEGETSRSESGGQAGEFNETRAEQRELAEELREFRETRREYEAAREADDKERARELARELVRRADRIEELGGNVSRGFRNLDGSSSADLDAAANATNETVDETTRTASEAEEASLTPVEFDVSSDDVATVASPATVSGRVTAENGSAISTGTVVVRDAAGIGANATLEPDGSWSVAYRPTRIGTGETTLTVAYVPEATSPYLEANATTNVTVEATNATVTVDEVSDEASYGENVTATGRVGAADHYPANVTVTLRADGWVVGTARTDDDGSFTVTGPLPAGVPAGNVTVGVQGGEAGTAVAPATASRSLSVASTETSLSAAVDNGDETATISGRLTTADGEAVADESVTLVYDGEARPVRTNYRGYYSVVVDRPGSREEAVVRYASAGGNLEDSRATVAVEPRAETGFGRILAVWEAIGAPGLADSLWTLVTDHPVLSAFAGLAILAAGAVWLLVARQSLRRRGEATSAGGEGRENQYLEDAVRRVRDDPSGLAAARQQLETAPSTAVQLAHSTVRAGLGIDDSRTHWEVYRAASDDLDEERRAALRTVTEAFEAATFSPEGVDRERASAALADAERCLSATDGGEPWE